ncbi:MAG: hypothetical protein R3C44_23775 [Chloroflexota bacterium]
MAANLLTGFDLTVWNRTPAKMAPLMKRGLPGHQSGRSRGQSTIVVTCVQ